MQIKDTLNIYNYFFFVVTNTSQMETNKIARKHSEMIFLKGNKKTPKKQKNKKKKNKKKMIL